MIPLIIKTLKSKILQIFTLFSGKLRSLAKTNNKSTICSLLYLYVNAHWYFKYFIFNPNIYYRYCITQAVFTYLSTCLYHSLFFIPSCISLCCQFLSTWSSFFIPLILVCRRQAQYLYL